MVVNSVADAETQAREEVYFWRKLIEKWAPHVSALERRKMQDALDYAEQKLVANTHTQPRCRRKFRLQPTRTSDQK